MSHFSTIFFRSLQPKLSQVMNTICIIKSWKSMWIKGKCSSALMYPS
jgi:hypothetical protein